MEKYDGHDDAVNDDAREPEAAAPPPGAPLPGAEELGAAGISDLLAGLTADPAAELSSEHVTALFEVALGGEPPSTVTAESVLREVRASEAERPARFLSAEWFSEHTTVWKWGGGLVAAAAAVAAVVLIAPNLSGVDSLTAGASADSAQSAPSPESAEVSSAASKDDMDESSPSSESFQLAAPDQPMAAMDGAEAPAEGSMSLESASGLSGDDAGGAAPRGDGDTAGGGSAGDAGPAQTSEGYSGSDAGSTDAAGDGTAAGLGDTRQSCPLAPLTAAEKQAVTGFLVARGFVAEGVDELCGVAGVRGETVRLLAKDAAVRISLAEADGAGSSGEASASQSADGSLTVTEYSATWIVTVTASPQAAVNLDTGMLSDLAAAVLAAAG